MTVNPDIKGTPLFDAEYVGNDSRLLQTAKSGLYHSLEWYTWVYITRDYGITYLFHATTNTGLRTAR